MKKVKTVKAGITIAVLRKETAGLRRRVNTLRRAFAADFNAVLRRQRKVGVFQGPIDTGEWTLRHLDSSKDQLDSISRELATAGMTIKTFRVQMKAASVEEQQYLASQATD